MPNPEEFREESEVHIPMHSLSKLACQKSSNGSITSALVGDERTGMRLDAGQVIEARAKEVQYIKDTGYTPTSPEEKLKRKGGQ